MAQTGPGGAVRGRDAAILVAASFALSATTALVALGVDGLATLGTYFDGHFYIEIGRSFPLPYAADGRDYLGQAPGFAALLALLRAATFGALDWAWIALLATWITGATAVLAFHALCREVGVPPLAASLTFLFCNPAWALVSSAAHPEPLAMTFALLCFVAHRRGALGWSVAWLALAMWTRFPALLLGGALAFDLLVVQRRWSVRTFAWLAVPLAAFAAHNAYLYWRVPGFTGIWDVHQVHWVAEWTWPFHELLRQWSRMAESSLLQRPIVYGTVALYLAASLRGLWPAARGDAWLSVATALVLALHVSLTGEEGVQSFGRLAVLAWPFALLVVWRVLPDRLPNVAVGAACLAGAVLAVWVSSHQIRIAVYVQGLTLWMNPKLAELERDEPRWIDFKEIRDLDRVRVERRRRLERLRAERAGVADPTSGADEAGRSTR